MKPRIWKYPLTIIHGQTIQIPATAKVLHVGLDPNDKPCLWALLDPRETKVDRLVVVLGTGFDLNPLTPHHAGSFRDGRFMWHVFTNL